MKEYKKNYLVESLVNWIWLFLTICFILLPVIIVSYIKDKETDFNYVFIFLVVYFLFILYKVANSIKKTKQETKIDVIISENEIMHDKFYFELERINKISYNPGIYDKADTRKNRPSELIVETLDNEKHIITSPSIKLVKQLKENCRNATYKTIHIKTVIFTLIASLVLGLIVSLLMYLFL